MPPTPKKIRDLQEENKELKNQLLFLTERIDILEDKFNDLKERLTYEF